MTDRNRTVSRRSKPNSRTTLIGEQPNPWNRLQLQDVMSRHRTYVRIYLFCNKNKAEYKVLLKLKKRQ
jgi:hypothetical protein